MRRLLNSMLSLFIILLVALLMPSQTFADSLPKYLSEIKAYRGGSVALTGGAGLILGAVVTALAMKPKKKIADAYA